MSESVVTLHVNGMIFGGWKSVTITRALEQAAGSFQLEVTEHWSGQGQAWPIREEDACRVAIDNETVIDGYVDRVNIALAGDSRSVTVQGSDAISMLTACSADLTSWTFRNADVLVIAQKVAAPFAIQVTADAGLELPKVEKLAVNPGDTPYDAIERAARTAGVLIVSDGAGGLRLTRAGTDRVGDQLIEGVNLLAAKAMYDASNRFHRYRVLTQKPGTDNASADATRIVGEAIDEGVRRTERVLIVRPSESTTLEYARRRADWEARVRAARGQRLVASVKGWRQQSGALWPLNEIVHVTSPSARVAGDLLITRVENMLSDRGGEITRMELVRPDAYTPQPRIAKVTGGRGGWPELAEGAL